MYNVSHVVAFYDNLIEEVAEEVEIYAAELRNGLDQYVAYSKADCALANLQEAAAKYASMMR